MKKILLSIQLCLLGTLTYSQSPYRDDAGLRGDAGAISGFFQTEFPVNYPAGAVSWWHLLDVRHVNTTNNFAMQFAGSFFDQNFWVRKTNNNPAQPWSKILTETAGKVDVSTKMVIEENSDGEQLTISRNNEVGHEGPGVVFKNMVNGGVIQPIAGIESKLLSGTTNYVAGSLNLYSFYGSAKVNAMTITNGNVGIGTSSPSAKLDVNGAMILNGPAGATLTLRKSSTNIPGISFEGATSFSVIEAGDQAMKTYIGGNYRTTLLANGNFGIGTETPVDKLSVNGKIRAHEIKVEATNWPDYVFEHGYQMSSLTELEEFIKINKHLPGVPTAKTVVSNGLELGEMNRILLQKVEELTLHLIDKEKELRSLNRTLKDQEQNLIGLKETNEDFKKRLIELERKLNPHLK